MEQVLEIARHLPSGALYFGLPAAIFLFVWAVYVFVNTKRGKPRDNHPSIDWLIISSLTLGAASGYVATMEEADKFKASLVLFALACCGVGMKLIYLAKHVINSEQKQGKLRIGGGLMFAACAGMTTGAACFKAVNGSDNDIILLHLAGWIMTLGTLYFYASMVIGALIYWCISKVPKVIERRKA